jgi:MFS superfamily sulfate permease-like transporter
VLVGVLAVVVLGLEDKGVDVVGQIAGGLPSLGLPDASAPDYLAIAGGAAGVALVGFRRPSPRVMAARGAPHRPGWASCWLL